jgi:hypothetical protein
MTPEIGLVISASVAVIALVFGILEGFGLI